MCLGVQFRLFLQLVTNVFTCIEKGRCEIPVSAGLAQIFMIKTLLNGLFQIIKIFISKCDVQRDWLLICLFNINRP